MLIYEVCSSTRYSNSPVASSDEARSARGSALYEALQEVRSPQGSLYTRFAHYKALHEICSQQDSRQLQLSSSTAPYSSSSTATATSTALYSSPSTQLSTATATAPAKQLYTGIVCSVASNEVRWAREAPNPMTPMRLAPTTPALPRLAPALSTAWSLQPGLYSLASTAWPAWGPLFGDTKLTTSDQDSTPRHLFVF